jgi:murein DD-endopeptidase MepM/ murein hydrolase activator NlpD
MSKGRRLAVVVPLALLVSGVAVFGIVVRTHDDGSLWRSAPDAASVVSSVANVGSLAMAPALAAARTTTVALQRGDNLVRALARSGIAARIGVDVADALRAHGANLRRLRPRDTLAITWSLAGNPVRIAFAASPWLGFAAIALEGGGWRVERVETQPDVRTTVVAGEVTRSLFHAIEDAGESPQLVLDFVEIFESDFDFTADARPGDRFRLLVEKRFAGDAFVDYGRVLGAQYLADGQLFTGVVFERPGAARAGYYDLEGRSLTKSFLKSPLEFSRITSGFTYARPHPILGGTRPHLAIDYAAPVGTPVRAVADGVVVGAGWAGGNGIQVRLRHRAGYETMYNHLSRAAVGRSDRVRQRQVIGYVGSTGLSTGPHLDYRVSKNGVFVNPLGEKFVPGDPITADDRARFDAHARTIVRRLESEAGF